ISSVHKGNGDFRILATPATFGGYQIKSSGWYNGYLFASVDTLGIFVLKPGQTTWAPFNEGLYPYTFSDFYFDDSLIYGRIDALKWLWSRSVLDLTPVVTLENPEQNTPEVFVNVYPNPAHNSITVVKSVDGNSTFRLFDAVGNKYLEKQGHEAIITLDVSGLSAGLYFVEISSDKFKITKKVVIAR
ncbi:MAG: hypothetical protein JWO06_3622, partial [Bacteroidota bacterium]|nr:hypothetical protein [Bacteroidota bacterium]